MNDEEDQSEHELLQTEVEEDEVPFVEYDISVNPSDHSLELLSQMVSREDIVIPFYQRRFVWKIEQASKLIESFLMGLPVPQIFLYVNDEDQLEVIDGQQRLMSVHYFMEGYFGEADSRGNRKVFRLKGLAQRSEYNGKTFEELASKDQRKLRNSTLRAIHIKQIRPSGDNDAVFHIFERLNTGGTLLRPQEIRNAVYRGPIVDKLQELNQNSKWQKILGLNKPDKSQKDVELILRLFCLFENWANYERPMLSFLNHGMRDNRAFDTDRAIRFAERFQIAVNIVSDALERPFRPKGVINASVLEAVMVAILEDNTIDAAGISQNYSAVLDNSSFADSIYGSTTNETSLSNRITIAKRILSNGPN